MARRLPTPWSPVRISTWNLGATLAPQASLALTFRMHVGMVALAQYTNAGSAAGLDGGGAALTPPSDTALITVLKPETTSPTLSITKSLAKGQPAVVGLGDPVRYTIVVTNTGNTAMLTVPLHDTFDQTALHVRLGVAGGHRHGARRHARLVQISPVLAVWRRAPRPRCS